MASSEFALDRRAQLAIAATLPDAPETCIARHALFSGRCRAWGSKSASIIDPDCTRGELLAFGEDAREIARVLAAVPRWKCVEISPGIAGNLAAAIAESLSLKTTASKDLYYTLTREPSPIVDPAVRMLGPDDENLYTHFITDFGDDPWLARYTVSEGPVAAAIAGGRVVASIEANVRTERYANFMAMTLANSRGRGFSTAAGVMCARAVQQMGLIPLWSCHENNLASQRVAEKIGFTPISHCVYLFPER